MTEGGLPLDNDDLRDVQYGTFVEMNVTPIGRFVNGDDSSCATFPRTQLNWQDVWRAGYPAMAIGRFSACAARGLVILAVMLTQPRRRQRR